MSLISFSRGPITSLFALLLSLNFNILQAQTTLQNAPPKLKEAFKKVNTLLQKEEEEQAIRELEKILKKNPDFVNAHLVLGDLYRGLEEWDKSEKHFLEAIRLVPEYDIKVYVVLAQVYMAQGKYPEAAARYREYLAFPNKHEEMARRARKGLGDAEFRPKALANPLPFEPRNLGPEVNSEAREYFPCLTADGQTLVFTYQAGRGPMAQEDLYQSQRNAKGEWQKAKPIPNVNTPENEGAQSISADGKLLVFTVCNREGDYGSCDLYFSEFKNKKWTKPRNIGPPISSPAWESQPSVAPNGEAIYFVRKGPGGTKIHVSHRLPDGKWGQPEVIQELASEFREHSPFIHPDGQTLYFASDGHPGFGGTDLFLSRRQADGQWGKPQNLGYPINTPKDEEALTLNFQGTKGYIASDRPGGYGSHDIYEFNLAEALRPSPVTYVQAVVVDAQTKKPLQAKLSFRNHNRDSTFLQSQADDQGQFLVCLPLGQDYGLQVENPGYVFHSERFALEEANNSQAPLTLRIELQPLPLAANPASPRQDTAKPIVLRNVFFETGSAKLLPRSKAELDRLNALLKEQAAIRIEIHGHTDSEGELQANMRLSEQRAEAVRQYLIEQGIDAKRLGAKGFGPQRPIADNNNPEGRALNRRTEFIILP